MSSAAPGWYPVEGDDRLRWWDGQAWTLHFQDKTGPSASVAGTAAPEAASHLSVTGSFPEDAIWTATGKSVTGTAAGRYWLTSSDLFSERGGQRPQQVPVASVVDVDVKQGMTQKARGVFTVQVHLNRGGAGEVVTLDDIPDGRMAVAIIKATAHQARLAPAAHQDSTTGHGGVPTQSTAQPAVQPAAQHQVQPHPQAGLQPSAYAAAADPMELLRKLGDLHDAGILSDEEFASKKAQILSRL